MKKALPITLILIGTALLITAVVFWIDSSTSPEPQSFGKTLLDWVTLIAGLGASIKGWIDLFKKEKPTSLTAKIDIKGSAPQVSIGDHARNVHAQTYIETQIIQQSPESKKISPTNKDEPIELSDDTDIDQMLINGSRIRFLDALDSARFSSDSIYNEARLFSVVYVKVQFFFAMISGDSIIITENQLFDSFGFLETFDELHNAANKMGLKELPLKVALREGNNVYQTIAKHIENKDFLLTLWKDLDKDVERRKLWAQFIRNQQKPPEKLVRESSDENLRLDRLWAALGYFTPNRCVSADNIPGEFSKRVKRITELSDKTLINLNTGIFFGADERVYLKDDEVDAAEEIRNVLLEIQDKLGELRTRSMIRQELAHYANEELREGVIELTDGIYNQTLGIATRAMLIQSSTFPPRRNKYVTAGYSLSTYIKDTTNLFNQFVDWELFSFDYFENLQRLNYKDTEEKWIAILETARKNVPWTKLLEMQNHKNWQESLKNFRGSLTKLQTVVRRYRRGSFPSEQRENLEVERRLGQSELENNWKQHIENVSAMVNNSYWKIDSMAISFTDPGVEYSIRVPYSFLRPKMDMEKNIRGIEGWHNTPAFKGRFDDRIDSRE